MAVNPDPTVTSLSLALGSVGQVTATVTTWEMVTVVDVPAQTFALPAGTFRVTLMVVGLPGDHAPAAQVSQQTVSGGTVTIPATKLRHLRDFTAARSVQVFATVEKQVGGVFVPYATTGNAGIVAMPAAAVPAGGGLPLIGAAVGQVTGSVAALTLVPQTYLDGALQAVKDMGGNLTRNDPQWMQLCPASTAFDATTQAAYDAYFTSCAAKGLKVIVFLEPIITSPTWAASSGVRGNPPASWSDFTSYVTGFLSRWGANIAAVELINEPNIQSYPNGGGSTTYSDYVSFLSHLYTAVKASSYPSIPVLAGCLSLCDSTYLAGLYAQAAFQGPGKTTPIYDAISVHPYGVDNGQFDTPISPAISSDPSVARPDARKAYDILCGLAAIHELMRANGDGTTPVWVTELGWPAGVTGTGRTFTSYDVSEDQQATYLAYALRALCRLGYVAAVCLFAGIDRTLDVTDAPYGIVDALGSRRKPAVAALTTAITALKAGTG